MTSRVLEGGGREERKLSLREIMASLLLFFKYSKCLCCSYRPYSLKSNKFIVSLAVRQVAKSCWNHMICRLCCWIWRPRKFCVISRYYLHLLVKSKVQWHLHTKLWLDCDEVHVDGRHEGFLRPRYEIRATGFWEWHHSVQKLWFRRTTVTYSFLRCFLHRRSLK